MNPSPPPPPGRSAEVRDVRVVHPWHFRLLVFIVTGLGAALVWALFKTVRLTVINGEREREMRKEGAMFYAIWHRAVIWSVYFWRWRGGFLLASAGKDGEWATGLINRYGNRAVRGSSSRGGRAAMAEMVELLKSGVSGGLIPDAPRGPERISKPGALVVAQRAGVAIIPTAFAASRCWRLKNWDRTIIPKPFSRAVVKFGAPFAVDRSVAGEEFDRRLREFDVVMNQLADDVDEWVRLDAGT